MGRILTVVLLVLTLAACSDTSDAKGPSTADTPSGTSDARDATCAEVRAGIDDFNEGDFTGTVRHFERAVAPARENAEKADDGPADDLLEAVEYYAELAPDDYPAASLQSPDFARHKATTLGQCASGREPSPGLAA